MFNPVTTDQAAKIAAKFGLDKPLVQIDREVAMANELLNTAFPSSSRECCERNEFYMHYHSNSYHARVYDPRDVLAYWYVQEADEPRIEALAAADFEDRAYGIDA